MSELPSGTVTFLFTDLEGSTRLLKELGRDGYHEILDEHQRLLRAAFEAHGGRIVDTQGDSFFVAFRTAADAVAAAVDAQRDLAAARWPEGVAVKVRMGLHTGEPKVGGERYVGIGVHRAARIGACGHGGQVLLSSTTKELAEEELPPGVTIRDLGVRRLKDIDQPQHIYQLDVEGLQSKFAELNTLDVALRRKKRRMYAGSALIGVLAAAVAVPVFALGQSGAGSGLTVEGNAVAEIDPASNSVVGQVANVGARPGPIAYGSGKLWVANLDDQTVARVDPSSLTVTHSIALPDIPTSLATTPGAVWVVGENAGDTSDTVRRIDTQFDTVSARSTVENAIPGGPGYVAAQGSTVWVAPSGGLVSRLDPQTARIRAQVDPNSGPAAVAIGAGATWVTDGEANTLVRIDPTGALTPIGVGDGPSSVAVGEGAVWVANTLDGTVTRVDATTRSVTTTIPVGRAPTGIAVGAGAVWVANSGDGTVTRIDPAGAAKPRAIRVGGSPSGVVVAQGRVWVTVGRQSIGGATAATPGGTLRIESQYDIDSADPALAYDPTSWQVLYTTCAKLVNYPDRAGPAGSQLAAEAAEALPKRSPDGKTYTFTIRPGFKFSPPSNQPVNAETFRYTIERTLAPRMKSPADAYMQDVVGANAYMAGKAAHISGIQAQGSRLTIHLVAPAPDLPTRLGLPFFCAVPVGTPVDPKGLRTIPSAGPYYVQSYVPGQGVVLLRNPNYHGSRPHHLDKIVLTVGESQRQIDADVEAGRADYSFMLVASADASRLAARYGPGSAAAKKGRQRFFIDALLGTDWLAFNTHRPPFSDARLRRAVAYAIDRRALAKIGSPFGASEEPTDQFLPPGMPGFKDAHVYPLTPDVAAARRLAGTSTRTIVLYVCNKSPCDRLAQVLKSDLAPIGMDVVVRTFPQEAIFAHISRKQEPFDIAFSGGWVADYPDPGDFLNFALEGVPGSLPSFDDPSYKREVDAAARLSGPRRYLAYGALDARVARTFVPDVAIGNFTVDDFFSSRMGCVTNQPVYGIDVAALCFRR